MVEIKELTFGYRKGSKLFNELNLRLEQGKIYGLLGKNGAGKTTLLKHLTGLLFPDGGDCNLFGESASKRIPAHLQDIFLIPEEFYLPVINSATYVAINSPFYGNFDHREFKELMKEFSVDEQVKLSSLSYGQKKKFLLAFGLATNARLLILDEPTNGLDIPSKSQFRKIIASRMNELRTVIISTHQVRDLSNLIDHVTILDNGKIIFHQEIMSISKHFSFGILKNTDDHEVIYSEDALGGKAAMYAFDGKETEIDLELLFNGVINKLDVVNNYFKTR
jgi:ABC-2 type transport system ATP-binding protein